MRTFPTLAGCQEPDAPTDRLGGSCNAEPTCVGGSSSRDAPDAPGLLCLATKSMSDQAVTAFFALGWDSCVTQEVREVALLAMQNRKVVRELERLGQMHGARRGTG